MNNHTPQTYTAEQVAALFPLAQSGPAQDGGQQVLFDDGRRQVIVEVLNGKLVSLFWRDRQDGSYDGRDWD